MFLGKSENSSRIVYRFVGNLVVDFYGVLMFSCFAPEVARVGK